jgi:hypothetical protein
MMADRRLTAHISAIRRGVPKLEDGQTFDVGGLCPCGLKSRRRTSAENTLHRHAAEFDFRWNARKIDDGAKVALAVRRSEGKRLRYREPLATLPPTPAQGRPF